MRAEDHTVLDVTAVARPGGLWHRVEVKAVTGSTNADLLALAAAGAPEGVVLAAEEQSAGRGRLGRAWVSPPRAALTFSLLLRPSVPPARLGWLTLLTGVAVASAVREVSGVDARLKWPNDVLVGPAKLAGILAEACGEAVVVGIGLNVSTERSELLPSATSLHVLGARTAREPLLAAILAGFEARYQAWRRAGGDPERCGLREEYLRWCGTIGRQVRVERPGAQPLSGLAAGVDPDGRLLVRDASGVSLPVAAGDVVHVRLSLPGASLPGAQPSAAARHAAGIAGSR
jgi:BirA family biotin operon repressor/biotin-[acetyl-CoA-carboxylase] ligase